MAEKLALLPDFLAAHLRLSLLALRAGTPLRGPLTIPGPRLAWLDRLLLGRASAVQPIPGLALLALMVPGLAWLWLPGIVVLPALLGLLLYCMLPILTNSVLGRRGIDPAVLEAASGVGMSPGQCL